MIVVENEHDLEKTVYLKTDPDQRPRIVTAIKIMSCGVHTYELSHNTYTSWHWGFEFSETKDYSVNG